MNLRFKRPLAASFNLMMFVFCAHGGEIDAVAVSVRDKSPEINEALSGVFICFGGQISGERVKGAVIWIKNACRLLRRQCIYGRRGGGGLAKGPHVSLGGPRGPAAGAAA